MGLTKQTQVAVSGIEYIISTENIVTVIQDRVRQTS